MGKEIEHKYLVKDTTYKEMARTSHHIVQGYLQRDPLRTVRVRIRDERGFITVKGLTRGDTRLEFEYEIPLADAREMIGMCEGKVIDKTRWIVDFGGYIWEVDEFHGDREGLTVAEIELRDSSHAYPLPPFAGKEVTGDPAYYNSNL